MEKKPHFPVLEAEIARIGISKKTIAAALGMKDPSALSRKLSGKIGFSLNEAVTISNLLGKTVNELFVRE